MNEKVVKELLTGTIYVSVFLLLIEWLKPVIELTDTDHLKLFSYFLGISLLFYFVQLNWKYNYSFEVNIYWMGNSIPLHRRKFILQGVDVLLN